MNSYLVYKATSPSNKVYIGLTGKTLSMRKDQHESLTKSNKVRPFQMALKKYSFNFQWEIVEEGLTLEQAEDREKYYISLYRSTDRDFGYNLSPGGLAGSIMSEDGKKRHKEKMDAYWSKSENREKASEKTLADRQKDPEAFLKRASEATKEYYANEENRIKHLEHMRFIASDRECTLKRSKSMGGKPFICNETGERFELLKDAADRFGVDRRQVHCVLSNPKRYKTILRKYTFSYIGE